MADHLIEMGRARCPKGKILRSGYRRKDGVRVKAACIPDKGAPGKTPAAKKFLPHLGPRPLGGWKESQSASERHAHIKKQVERKGCRHVIRDLVAIANVTTDRPTEKKLRADQKWLHDQGFCKLKTK